MKRSPASLEMAENPIDAIRVTTETRNLRSQPFVVPEDPCETGKAWEDCLEEIEREFRYFKITEPIDKKDVLIIYGGKELARLEKSLPDPPDGDTYVKLRTKLNEHYLPRKNKYYSRYLFLKLQPNPEETIIAYTARLREKVQRDCEFGSTHDERILELIIQTIDNKTQIKKTISKEWNLTQFLTEAGQMEDIKRQVTDMKSEQPETEAVSRVEAATPSLQPQFRRRRWHQKIDHRQRSGQTQQQCDFCGYNHGKEDWCPAIGKIYRNCNKRNHFSSVCHAPNNKETKASRQYEQQTGRIKRATGDESTSSDDECFIQEVRHLLQAKKIKEDRISSKTVRVRLDDIDINAEPDSGADENVMDEHQFKALIHRTAHKPTLQPSKTKQVKGNLTQLFATRPAGDQESSSS